MPRCYIKCNNIYLEDTDGNRVTYTQQEADYQIKCLRMTGSRESPNPWKTEETA